MADAQSFYFFDFDKNIMKVRVPFVLINTRDGSRKEVSGHEFAKIRGLLGKEGPWKDWSGAEALLNYRDVPGLPASEQPFVKQIEHAIDGDDETSWQGLAWDLFVHACDTGRPLSLITARGHADDTIKAGFEVLRQRGYIQRTPNYLTIFNVNYPPTQEALGGTGDVRDDASARLKRVAVLRSVDKGVEVYGRAPHRFGMSDDTMVNIEFVADAMRECKEKYPGMRFFVISTNPQHELKAEIFPLYLPVTGSGAAPPADPLETHAGA